MLAGKKEETCLSKAGWQKARLAQWYERSVDIGKATGSIPVVGTSFMKLTKITCKNCKAACCKVFGIYELNEEDRKRVPRKHWTTYKLYPGWALMKTKNFQCTILDAETNKCSLYDKRPSICRRFEPGSKLCKIARKEYKQRFG